MSEIMEDLFGVELGESSSVYQSSFSSSYSSSGRDDIPEGIPKELRRNYVEVEIPKRKPKVENAKTITDRMMRQICNHCGYPIALRNPSNKCDHLYYPDNCHTCRNKKPEDRIKYLSEEPLFICPKASECPHDINPEDVDPDIDIEYDDSPCPHQFPHPYEADEGNPCIEEWDDKDWEEWENGDDPDMCPHCIVYHAPDFLTEDDMEL